MKKAKTLTVVLTLSAAIIITLGYMIATNKLIGTSANSSIIVLQAASNNNSTEEVSSTKLAKDKAKNNTNEEEKLTVTSRSGKHEAIVDVAETAITEVTEPQVEVTQTEAAQAEAPVEENVEEAIEEQAEDLGQEPVEEPALAFEGVELEYSAEYNVCSSPLTKSKGVTYYDGHKETYYSQRVLAGNGLKALNNNGRHVADDGTVRDGNGYIAVACNYLPKGSEIMTSLGPGKVYDTGGMSGKWIDIYVNW